MGILYQPEELNILALEETLQAVELLLPTYDLDGKSKPLFDGQARMGFPAATLLFCFVESIGHLTGDRKKPLWNSFKVLQEDLFQTQSISDDQCKYLYDEYRCKLCHNSMLPMGFKIDCLPGDENIFYFTEGSINAKKIILVNLLALLNVSQGALAKIKRCDHRTLFYRVTGRMVKEVLSRNLKHDTITVSRSPSGLSGYKD